MFTSTIHTNFYILHSVTAFHNNLHFDKKALTSFLFTLRFSRLYIFEKRNYYYSLTKLLLIRKIKIKMHKVEYINRYPFLQSAYLLSFKDTKIVKFTNYSNRKDDHTNPGTDLNNNIRNCK